MLKLMLNKRSVGILFMPYLLLAYCASHKINRMFLSLNPILFANALKKIFYSNPIFQSNLVYKSFKK